MSASRLGLASSGMIVDARRIALAFSKVSVRVRASFICSNVASGIFAVPALLFGHKPVSIFVGAGDPLVSRCNAGAFFGGTDISQGRSNGLYYCC